MEKISFNRPVILAVDDMSINLRAVKVALEAFFDVRLAKSGELALSIVASEAIDLILLDIEMPEMSGFEFLKKLKNSPTAAGQPPVIFVTAHAPTDFIIRAKIAGAVGYVLKPFDPEVLRKKISDALESAAGEAPKPDQSPASS